MNRTKKTSLRVRILLVLVLLVFVEVIEIGGINFLMQEYSAGIENMNRNVIELTQENLSDTFSSINRELAYLLANESDFIRLPYILGEEITYERSMEFMETSQAIKKRLGNLSNMYGSKYYFWYYDTDTRTFIDSFYENQNKIKYKTSLIDKIDNHPKHISESRKFEISDQKYIELLNNRGTIYVGASISIDDFYRLIVKTSMENECEYSLFDEDGTLVESRIYSKGKERKDAALNESSFLQYERIQMKACGFQAGIAVTNSTLKYAEIINYFLLISQLAFVMVVILIMIFARRGILSPLRKFSRMLEEFPERREKIQPENIQELGEAGMLLNRLVEQITELERTVYEEQLRKQKIQLDYAQIQIRPHFFINCLNVIHSMARVGREEEIQDLCLYVSSYLRSLYSCSTETYLLSEELKLIWNYLNIVKEVNGQRFELNTEIDEEAKRVQIPPLLIETFIENSLKYARSIKQIEISVRVRVEEMGDGSNRLNIQIEDTGKGFQEEVLKSLNTGSFERTDERHQIGIINIRERLSLIYGDRGKIRFYNTQAGAGVEILIEKIDALRDTGKDNV